MISDEKSGVEKGLKDTLLEIINLWLFLKFGNESRALFNRLKDVNNVEKLKQVKELIMKARNLEELKKELEDLV